MISKIKTAVVLLLVDDGVYDNGAVHEKMMDNVGRKW